MFKLPICCLGAKGIEHDSEVFISNYSSTGVCLQAYMESGGIKFCLSKEKSSSACFRLALFKEVETCRGEFFTLFPGRIYIREVASIIREV